MVRLIKYILSGLLLVGGTAGAQILVDTAKPTGTGFGLGPTLAISNVEYENEDGNTFEVDRKTIGLGIVGNVTRSVAILFQAGHTFESEFEDSDIEGEGYMIGGGLSFLMYGRGRLSLVGYTLLNYVSDSFGKKKPKIDMDVMDLHIGFLPVVRANSVVSLYAGVDLVPYSDGQIEFKDSKIDIERENMANLKLGMLFTLPDVTLKPEVTLIGEKSFAFMATFEI
jgi:hypothetical protein